MLRTLDRRWAAVALLLALAALAVTATVGTAHVLPTWVRLPVVGTFVLVGPGLATTDPQVRRLGPAILVAVSVAWSVLVCLAVLYAGVWSGVEALRWLAGGTAVIAWVRLARPGGERPR